MSRYVVKDLHALADAALAVLDSGESTEEFPIIDGRVLAVQASPQLDNSEDMAWGIAALPAGFSTPPHHHRAEEFAMVLRGSGTITIDGEPLAVHEGSIVVTPPDVEHVTSAGPERTMVVYWVYGPAGSESRWLERA